MRLLTVLMMILLLSSCSSDETGNEDRSGVTGSLDEGSLVGNSGNLESLNYTGMAIKALYYIDNKSYISQDVYRNIRDTIRRVRVYSLTSKLCPENLTTCSESEELISKSYKADRKIYFNVNKWNQLSTENKIFETIKTYSEFLKEDEVEYIDSLISYYLGEIYYQIFHLDYMVDVFRSFFDERNVSIKNIGSYNQIEFNERISMVMECFLLAENRFPNRVNVNALDLQDYFVNLTRIKNNFVNDTKTLKVGKNTDLQKCFNVMALKGLSDNTSSEEVYHDIVTDHIKINNQNIELWNYATRIVNYFLKYDVDIYSLNSCDTSVVRSDDCFDISNDEILEKIKTVYLKMNINFTEKTLCASNGQTCNSIIAINDPDTFEIIVNKKMWSSLKVESRIRILVHELLGLAGIEEENYFYSAQLSPSIYLEAFNVNFFSADFRDYMDSLNIKVSYAGGFLSQLGIKKQMNTAVECLKMVSSRFPGRLNIKEISLSSYTAVTGGSYTYYAEGIGGAYCHDYHDRWVIDYNEKVICDEGDWCKTPCYDNYYNTVNDLSKLSKIAGSGTSRSILYLGAETTVQSCYNEVVVKGLE